MSTIGGLAGLVIVELMPGSASQLTPAQPVRSLHQHHPSVVATDKEPVAELVSAILARPLFSPNRRPGALSLAPDAPRLVPPRLSGVIIDGADRIAIFAATKNGKPIVAGKGQTVGKWSVSAVDPGGVLLTGPGGYRRLRPTFAQMPAKIAAPPAAPPANPAAVATEAARRALLARLSD